MRAEYRKQKARAKFVKYLTKTWKNKLCAIAMVLAGVLGMIFVEDATGMFLVCFAVPLFFTKKQRFQ